MAPAKNARGTEPEEEDANSSTVTDASTCATQATSAETSAVESDVFGRYRAKPSIFASLEPGDDQAGRAEESRFLQSKAQGCEPPAQAEDTHRYLCRERGVLFKFTADEWTSIGEGTLVVLDEEKRRVVFSRVGVNIAALNFWLSFDPRPQVAGRAVKFFAPETRDGKTALVFHAVRVADEDRAQALAALLSPGGAQGTQAPQAEDPGPRRVE